MWQQVSVKLDREQIQRALNELPAEQRETVMLTYFGGYTHQEISRNQGVPLGTVKGRLRLAMGKLRSLLPEVAEGGSN